MRYLVGKRIGMKFWGNKYCEGVVDALGLSPCGKGTINFGRSPHSSLGVSPFFVPWSSNIFLGIPATAHKVTCHDVNTLPPALPG